MQLSKTEEICPPHPQPLPLAGIIFHLMNPILKVECAFLSLHRKMALHLMPPLSQKRTSLKCALKWAHTHPLGVLHYSTMELVALFHSSEDMQCATHRAIKATESQDEAIAIRAVAPSETHVKAYIMAVRGDHSKPQSPPSEGEGEPNSPPDNPHPSGETLHHLQAELGDLTDHELCSACGGSPTGDHTLWAECSPKKPSTNALGTPIREQESQRGWPGGHLSKRGRWDPLGQPSPSPTPTRPDRGWVSQGPPPQPPPHAQPDPDMGAPDKYSGIRFMFRYL